MLSVKRITKIIQVPPRTMKVYNLSKSSVRVKTICELSPFFKSLLETYDLNALLSEKKALLRVEELAVFRLMGEKDERNKKAILSILEDTRRKIDSLNLKIYALLHEIPISENEVNDWKREIISLVDYIYNAQINKLEYSPLLEEFLNSRVSKLVSLKEAINYRIKGLEKKIEEFEEELNNIEVKHSIGLLDHQNYTFLRERIEETLRNTIDEIRDLKNFDMRIKFLSQVQLIERNLNETSQKISQIEEKYKACEISTEEYNRLIIELKKEEKDLSEQLIMQKKIFEEYQEKIKALRSRIVSLDKLLV
jgi:chromosome segregation ATPase